MNGLERVENLFGVPSYHYDPVFAGRVRDAMHTFRPTAVALECPEAFRSELEWALTCWPAPVCSRSGMLVVPFVPGDSILEAHRLATESGVPVHMVDLLVAERIVRPGSLLPGAECADRVGDAFRETFDALETAAGPPAPGDLAREAHMARRLRALMDAHERVLWVGGMAHWTRLAGRLRLSDFAAPFAREAGLPRFERLRLAPAALEHLTGRVPHLVARYAADPESYDEADAIRALALDAVDESKAQDLILLLPGQEEPAGGAPKEEATSPADLTRFLLYARNLAVSHHIGDRPDLAALLLAASSTIGNRYAGRLFVLAMQEPAWGAAEQLPRLEYDADDESPCFRLRGRRVRVEPAWGGRARRAGPSFSLKEARRRLEGVEYMDLPGAGKDERKAWLAYPPDEEAYEAFVQYVLRRATLSDPNEAKSMRFLCGLLDGLDMRATARHWHDGKIYVREDEPTRLNITNGIIDFSSATEHSALLRGRLAGGSGGGWIDPDLLHVGSVSRHVGADILRSEPFHLQRDRRLFSMITLDCPTWLKQDDSKSFWSLVIRRLVELPPEQDHLYGWLEVMFEFCARKPLVYYSRYVPSLRIHQIAWKHAVRVVHCPLRRIPRVLLERNREFLFFNVTRRQWEVLLERVAEGKSAWTTTGQRGV